MFASIFGEMFERILYVLNVVPFGIWLFVATIFLGYLAWTFWIHYVRSDFISGIDFVLIEIIPPRDVVRSPQAMELFFTNALYHYSEKGPREGWWNGEVQLWFSLEIVSIGGNVHFYVRSPSRLKELIETQIYAQYPQAQVKVVEDYTLGVDKITPDGKWKIWGCEFKLLKPDSYPIKTYVDFGLDKDPKEEYKIDPISPLIELFASIKSGEQMWLQIVITPAQKKYNHDGKKNDWVDEGRSIVEKLVEPFTKELEDGGVKMTRTPKWIELVAEAINKKTSKLAFETGIRLCYIADKQDFSNNSKRNMRLIFHQYSNPYINQLARTNSTTVAKMFLTPTPIEVADKANAMLNKYRDRYFFYHPLRKKIFESDTLPKTFILNTEELATLFHFPGQILKVPTLERIESKEASPPTNLPT